MNIDSRQIQEAAQLIREGELVAFPTETVYGLGADALNPYAVAKIFAAKERPTFDPLIVHIADLNYISELAYTDSEFVNKLAEAFWPGPLTMVLPRKPIIPDLVTADLPTVGIRMPNNEIALELIRQAQRPIAAPSANKFGRISPTKAEHVRKQLPDIKCILDGGQTSVGIESTVIALNADGFVILRQGIITHTELEKILPKSKFETAKETHLASPGLLNSHYSPIKPLYILGQQPINCIPAKAGFISFSGTNTFGYKHVEYLSQNADLKEAAANLFSILHKMEETTDIDYIIAEPVPAEGIGLAIMDKLKKAAYQYSNYKH